MGSEMPFVTALLSRLPEPARMIAAFGIVGSLSITIESPIIMLLATTTALARTRQNYLMIRRYTWHLMLATTLLHVLVGWTPVFDVIVSGWMRVPDSLVEPIRLGMRLMALWSAAIAWRRFRQGVLIRFEQTRLVGHGTVARLLTSVGLATLLALASRLPGIAVGTLALATGVIVEAAYAHLASARLIAQEFGSEARRPSGRHLTYGDLVRFHTPLAASTLLFLLTQPLISAALARLPRPELILAAWPVASGLLFITRAPVLSLPEVIIALLDRTGAASRAALRAFSLRAGLACTGILAVLGFTPLARIYFQNVIGVSEELATLASAGIQAGVVLPLILGWWSWYRGDLTAQHATPAIMLAMGANLATMAVSLAAGVAVRAPGVPMAAVALTLATAAEAGLLAVAARRANSSPQPLSLS